ncbi:MAG: hypothetical protein NT029_04530 [Armatimonadetes bacterium]|nr:hypothetical protein [Armatimonadota bacterium]
MQKRSWIAVGLAIVCLALAALLVLRPFDVRASAFGPSVVGSVMDQAADATRRADPAALAELLTSDGHALGMRRDQLRLALARSMRELRRSQVYMEYRNIRITGDNGAVVDVTVGERTQAVDVVYARTTVSLRFARFTETRLGGLYTVQRWLLSDVEAQGDFGLSAF